MTVVKLTEIQLLEYIRKTKLDRGPLSVTENSQSEQSILDSFSDPKSFLYELIQNADDAAANGAVKIKIEVAGDYLYLGHTGKLFSQEDVMALCSFGSKRIDQDSKSQDKSKIGYKGVGFKSVFKISDEVTILSDKYRFQFSKSFWEREERSFREQEEKAEPNNFGWDKASIEDWNKHCQMGQLENQIGFPWRTLPIYISEEIPVGFEDFNVITKIKINGNIEQDNFKKEINDLLGNSRLMLFLNSKNIEIKLDENTFLKSDENDIIKISAGSNKESWRLFSIPFEVNKEDLPSYAPAKMKKLKEIKISIALSLKDGKISTLEGHLCDTFSFLPTKEKLKFPFIVNSQFILDNSREHLADNDKWNENIFKKLGLLLSSAIEVLSQEEDNKNQVFSIFPSKIEQPNHYHQILSDSFKSQLKSIAFIPVYDCEAPKSINEVIIDKTGLAAVKELRPLVKMLLAGSENKFIVDDRDLFGLNKLEDFKIDSLSSVNIKSSFEKDEIQNFLNKADISIFMHLLKGFKGTLLEISLIKEIRFLKTNKEEIKAPVDLFLFNPAEKFIEELSFSFLSPKIYIKQDNKLELWVKEDLVIGDVEPKEVVDKFDNKRALLLEKEKNISFFKYLFKNKASIRNWDKVRGIKMLTNSGQFKEQADLYLSDCYNPIDSIEVILKEDVFISADYCKNPNDYEAWGKFFMNELEINNSLRYDNIESHENASHRRLGRYFKKKMQSGNNPLISNFFEYVKTIDKNNQVPEYLDSFGDNSFIYGFTKESIFNLKSIRFITTLSQSNYKFIEYFWGSLFNQIFKNPSKFIRSFGDDKPSFEWWHDGSGMYGIEKNFNAFIIENESVFPSFNNGVYKAKDILIPTVENIKFKDFLPVSSIEIPKSILDIKIGGIKLFQFKESPSDDDMIDILSKLNTGEITDAKSLLKIIYAQLLRARNLKVSETVTYYLTQSEGFVLRENVAFIPDRSLREKFNLKNNLYIPHGFTDDDELNLAKLLGIDTGKIELIQSDFVPDFILEKHIENKTKLFELASKNKEGLLEIAKMEVLVSDKLEIEIMGTSKTINAMIRPSKNSNNMELLVDSNWKNKRLIKKEISEEISKLLKTKPLQIDDILWTPTHDVLECMKDEGIEIKDEVLEYYNGIQDQEGIDGTEKNNFNNPVHKDASYKNGKRAEKKVFEELKATIVNRGVYAIKDEKYIFETDDIKIIWIRGNDPFADHDILVEYKKNGKSKKHFIEVKSTINPVFDRNGESLYYSDIEWNKIRDAHSKNDAYYLAIVFNNIDDILNEGDIHFVKMTPKKDVYQILEIDEFIVDYEKR